MIKRKLIIGILTSLLVTSSIIVSSQHYYAGKDSPKVEEIIDLEKRMEESAQNSKVETYYDENLEKTMQLVGEYLKNNSESLSKSVDAIKNETALAEDIVATVGSVPITIAEIEFRKGLNQFSNMFEASDKDAFNALVEEKMLIDYAIKNNVFPTEDEIAEILKRDRELLLNYESSKDMIKVLCTAAEITEEEYFNNYQYYNSIRSLIFLNAEEHIIETGIKYGLLMEYYKKTPDGRTYIPAGTQVDESGVYCLQYLMNLKKDIYLSINQKYLNRGFSLDGANFYMHGRENQ